MDEIYDKIAEFDPLNDQRDNLLGLAPAPAAVEFEVSELWRRRSSGQVFAYSRKLTVNDVPTWLNESSRATENNDAETLVLRLVWAGLNSGKRQVGLAPAALTSILSRFGLNLAFRYFTTSTSGVDSFPKTFDTDYEHQAYAFTYAPKLACIWSKSRALSAHGTQPATQGIIFTPKAKHEELRPLLHSKWQHDIASHAMFPSLLFSLLLSSEIEKTLTVIRLRVGRVERRTGYQTFETKRQEASGDLGALSAEMSGDASKLASAQRKSKTVEDLAEFIQKSIEESMDAQNLTTQDRLMQNHTAVIQQRLKMQAVDTAFILDRVRIQIQGLANLIAKEDSLNNFDIALSSHRDALSMKTLAVVTMLYLPGSFISALFSTQLFDWGDSKGHGIGIPSTPQFKLYWAITAPLTVLTFGLYWLWLSMQGRLRQRELNERATPSNELGSDQHDDTKPEQSQLELNQPTGESRRLVDRKKELFREKFQLTNPRRHHQATNSQS